MASAVSRMSDGTRQVSGNRPGTAISVAEAGLERVAELAELNRQLRDDEGYPDPMTDAQLVERMTNWLRDSYRSYLAYQDGRTVGYCMFRETPTYYQLRHLFVARDRRRRGVATALLDWMYSHVWSGKPVRLNVFSHNAPAVAFYRAYGFRIAVLRMEK